MMQIVKGIQGSDGRCAPRHFPKYLQQEAA